MKFAFTLIAVCIVVSGCASRSYCVVKQKYETAPSIQPLAAADGLKLPDSPTALRVPPPSAQDEPFGVLVTDPKRGRTRAQCLDQPPPLPASAALAPKG